MTLENQINSTIEAPLQHMGFNIVRLRLYSRNSGALNLKVLEILIERIDGVHISIMDCKNASNHISAILDVEDIIDGKYNLEVSSAGVERPLVKLEDYDRFKGYVAEIKLHNIPNGVLNDAKKYQCTIIGTEGNTINIRSDKGGDKGEIINIDFENIKDAKLVLTDELFKKIVK